MGRMGRHRKLNQGGFTLAEILLTVGILAILLTIAMPNVIQTQKELRQTGLDARAQVLYTAVQNQLLKLRADGRADEYAYRAEETNGVRDAGSGEIDGRTVDLCFLSSQDRGKTAVDLVMAPGVAEEELRSADWVVVYEPEGGSVVDVFFSESGALDYGSRSGHFNGLRGDRSVRLDDGATVGWYGGGALLASTQKIGKLEPTITVDNGERLIIYFQCKKPVRNAANHLEFEISFSDREGHTWSGTYTYTAGLLNWDITTDVYSVGLILDNLTLPEGRFNQILGSASSMPAGQELIPGYLKAEVTVTCPADPSMGSGHAQAETNSLFADDSTETTAYIRCCRHLQNLDRSSGVGAEVTAAVQRMPLSFKDDAGRTDDWYDCYHGYFFNGLTGGTANFKPIEPVGLKSYDGNKLKIEGLTVNSTGRGGLFESGTGFTWKNMTLASPNVYVGEKTVEENGTSKVIAQSGAVAAVAGNNCLFEGITVTGASVQSENATEKNDSSAGGLVGQAVGAGTVIRDCKVYLDSGDRAGKTDGNIWISGRNSGGLVGNVTIGASLRVEGSLAATVAGIPAGRDADVSAGGLVGEVGGGASLTVDRSYADCYLYGSRTGGLVAETKKDDAASRVSLSSCYAAGFQRAASSTAGLVNGLVENAARCYTISHMTMTEKDDMYGVAREISGTVDGVYYAQTGKYAALSGTSPIVLGTLFDDLGGSGGSFRKSVLGTVPYYLRSGLDLSGYPCPQLKVDGKALIHYGDWKYEKGLPVGIMGLSNGDLYHEVTRTSDAGNIQYRWGYSEPRPVSTEAEADVFLYAPLSDNILARAEIGEITAWNVWWYGEKVNSANGIYSMTFSDQVYDDGVYQYRSGKVRYQGNWASPTVYFTVNVRDPETGVTYTLQTKLDVVLKYKVTFQANGGEGTMEPIYLSTDYLPQPKCEFTRVGYDFDCWEDQNGRRTSGDSGFEIHENLDLTAQWRPHQYSIRFDDNGNSYWITDKVQAVTLSYDQSYTLPNTQVYANSKHLMGWNTAPDGSGTSYSLGQTIRNLTTENLPGESPIVFYCQWANTGGLRLESQLLNWWEKQISPADVYGKDQISSEAYPSLSRPGATKDLEWALEGWYTSNVPGEGVKVLDSAGKLAVQNLDGYVRDGKFCMEEDKTLYARWWQYGYLPVTALADGNDEEYLIMDKIYYNAGEGHFLSSANGNKVDGVEGARTVGTGTVEIKADWTNVVHDEAGNGSYLYIDSNGLDQRWIFHYETTENGRRYYQIKSKSGSQRLLCRIGDGMGMYTFTLDEIQTLAPGDYQNRMLWYYGSISWYNNLLADKLWINQSDTLRWEDGRGFFVGSGFGPVYLYRLQKIYQFY